MKPYNDDILVGGAMRARPLSLGELSELQRHAELLGMSDEFRQMLRRIKGNVQTIGQRLRSRAEKNLTTMSARVREAVAPDETGNYVLPPYGQTPAIPPLLLLGGAALVLVLILRKR